MKRSQLGAMLLCILFACTVAFGQTATTSLRGVVKDPAGALIPGATVTILDQSTGRSSAATSGASGLYQFPQIPPAHYLITVSASGFGNESKTAELLVNQPATIDFNLAVQSSAVTVDVTASAQTLNTSDATIGNSVGNEMIEALPLDGREPAALLSLQPGVLFLGQNPSDAGADGRQGAVSGSRSDQSSITIDGIDDNDSVNGFAFEGVLRSTLDSTEEFRVTTSNSGADGGRSSGAQISLITKSGTNKFHGALYEYHRPSNTVANDWFLKQSQISSGLKNRPTKYIQNVFGGSVGGPALRDKLFFFFNYEGQRIATNEAVTTAATPFSSFTKDKSLRYKAVDGSTQTLTTAQIATLDAGCTLCVAPGVDDALISYLAPEPYANGSSQGDGLNYGSYTFSSPRPKTFNTSIAKIDYNLNSKNHLFVRGNLQKDLRGDLVNLPGQPPSNSHNDNTKGIAFGHTFMPTSNIVNDLRYGYIRQGYSDSGIGQGDYVTIRFFTQPTAQTRSTILSVPTHNITDSFTWTKGNHTLQIGGGWNSTLNNNGSNGGSFSGASTNPFWLGGKPPQPTDVGLPAVDPGSKNDYAVAYSTIVGDIPQLNGVYNYKVSSPTTASLLPDGSFINRHFQTNSFEYYIQDSWRPRPNLTITFGIHHSLLQTPYETKGQQIAPTVDTHKWFVDRAAAAKTGTSNQPDLTFSPIGKANGKPGFWPKQKLNIAPRFSIAYSPDAKTTVRAGAGIYFDHYGAALAQRFSQRGSFGLSTGLSNPASIQGYLTSPRFTGPHDLPNIPLGTIAQNETYPYTPSDGNFLITWGIDNKLKTPYAEAFDFSLQRELPAGFTIEANYVGRLGRHLLQQLDLAEPVNLVDPKGAGDYYQAGAELSADADKNGGNYVLGPGAIHVPTIKYVEDVFPQMANLDYVGETATDGMYNNEWAANRYSFGATQSIFDVDAACYYGCPNGTQFWQQQFSSLYAWSTIGQSYYNALQLVLRHPSSHGLNLDFSYTFSKSMDMGSDVERGGYGYGAIQNSFHPEYNRSISDFDTKHLVSVDWAYRLPVGRGQTLLGTANHAVDTIIGGWQLAGIARLTSGLPFSVNEPGWTTNWELESWGVKTAPVKMRKHIDANGTPQIFDNPDAINAGVSNGGPIRLTYPGEAGQRNTFRGDGYANVDASLNKNFSLGEFGKMRFAWDVFNVANSHRFDVYSIGTGLTYGSLGKYSSELGGNSPFRHMQFSLRYDF